MALRPLVEDLEARRAQARLGGGEERIARQHEQGKLTARERLALLIDADTFTELGIHAGVHHSVRGLEGRDAPADGVITGYGKVDGRLVAVCAYDFTVMAGSMGTTGELKVARLRELALTKRMPFVWLLDSAGARIQEAVGSLFAGSGHLFREEVIASGVIPQVAALMGPCAAGTAYIPGLADFVPMVKGRGSMALAGPHLVRAAIGEDVTQEELGGSRVHCRESGVGDLEVADDEECIARIREYLSFFPSHCEQPPPRRASDDPADRMDDELLDVLPESDRQPYDMYEVIRRIVDDGDWLDLKPQWARTIITCLARMGGRPGGHRGQPAEAARRHPRQRLGRQGRALRQPLRRVRHPARVPDGRARLHGRHEGREGGDHPPRREDAARGRRRDRAEGHGRDPQGLRRRLLRDERPRVRAGPARRLAERRDLRDGSPRARSRSCSASRSRRPRTPRPSAPS